MIGDWQPEHRRETGKRGEKMSDPHPQPSGHARGQVFKRSRDSLEFRCGRATVIGPGNQWV